MPRTKEELLELIPQSWKMVLQQELTKPYWDDIIKALNKSDKFFPPFKDIFNALCDVTPDGVKVVMIGQDPYPTQGVAHGYSFSVRKDTDIPASLKNIFKELGLEYKTKFSPSNGDLRRWEKDGVLLLNSILTVEEHTPLAHKGIGWENFTKAILQYLATKKNVVFLTLGTKSRDVIKDLSIDQKQIVSAGHPSPRNLSNTFIGSDCFIRVNEILLSKNILPVRWLLL